MQLTNSFTITRPADEVFAAFLQVDRIATCMPGSTLLGQPEPGTYEGEVKVKVGPLSVTYAGQFVVVSADENARRLKMKATGREKRGAGSAEAEIVARLTEAEGQTTVRIDTDLDIRGKVAQFGRGVIGEVTEGIIQAFASNVEAMLIHDAQLAGDTAPPGSPSAAARSGSSMFGGASERDEAELEAKPAESNSLDAWSLIVRPMLARHGASIAAVGFSALAAWVGARAGVRSAMRRHAHELSGPRGRTF